MSMHSLRRHSIALAGALLLAAAALPALPARAQSLGVPPIQYAVSPETPGPHTQVSIEAQGVGSFVGDARITWQVDGKTQLSGTGARDFTFTTGGLGSQTHVHVTVVSQTQGTFTHDFVFIPASIDLVWEADTTVPPFYRGKALYSAGSELKVVAFPTVIVNGAKVSPASLSYQWSVDGNPLTAQSGLGATAVVFQGSQLQEAEQASVDVYLGGSKVGTASITIPAQNPQLVLYDDDPLRGVLWNAALPSAVSLTGKELTVEAVPYFFSDQSARAGSLAYQWTLNGADTSGPNSAQGILTLRQTGAGAGTAELGVSVQNNDADKLVQAASAALELVFGQGNTGGSLFGL